MIGVFINALARGPFVMVQGYGYAKWTGLLHLLELPPYAAALYWLLQRYGIEGAAIAWTGRIVIDTVVLYLMAVRLEPRVLGTALRDLWWTVIMCAAAIGLAWIEPALSVRVAVVTLVALCSASVLLRDVRRALIERGPTDASAAPPLGIGGRSGG
jgi:hypothetical protein